MGTCLITRKGGAKSVFPSGYDIKTGTLETSSLDGNKYIPLVAKIHVDYTNWNDSYAVTPIKDNVGKQYGSVGVGGSNSEANPRITVDLDIDLFYANNMNIEQLKKIRSFVGPQSASIVAWLEKK